MAESEFSSDPVAVLENACVEIETARKTLQMLHALRLLRLEISSSAPEMQDLLAGQIDLFFDTAVPPPLVRAGSIKAYAVTSETRSAAAPDTPTFAEMGLPRFSFSQWLELFVPKGTPKDINSGRLRAIPHGTEVNYDRSKEFKRDTLSGVYTRSAP
jgi:hypothetical protein